ncbi:type IV pilus biogenesis protein PilM [Lactococcus paracarnosus]|uniref:Pilus assembly protein PilM n=1 Tax=Pseudolactococcus paracarnosus TaxID=2749962 RepID=A0ABT0AL07_9LACT|nr:hypothetical protein [Lactococcus paracarnosus]MCJ1977241.1 hypothetical protein [Lactococcus paracarnosus]MCJ1983263.1 hypothetical protein [Lactococcus paracarnosus]MCJ1998073.1 hypothetical protein [Lactococcus paracarnosus]
MFGKSKKARKQLKNLEVAKQKKTSSKLIGLEVVKNVIRMTIIQGNDVVYGERLLEGTIIKRDKLRNTEELSDAMRSLAKELGVSGGHVVYHLNNQTVLIQELAHLAGKSEKQIRQTLFLELGDSISLPFSTPKFELLVANQPEKSSARSKKSVNKQVAEMGESQGLVANQDAITYIVTSEDLLIELGDCILQSGLKPAAVEFSALAVTRCFENKIDFTHNFMLVELAAGTATMTIFEGEVPIYVQYEDYNGVGWRYFHEGAELTYFFNEERERVELKKLIMVIEQLTYYYQTNLSENQDIHNIYVTGEHPWLMDKLEGMMTEDLQYPVNILQFPDDFPPKYTLSLGLAMKEV